MAKQYALFLGCTIPARSRSYELSVRAVAGRLGVELIDVEAFACCGFPIAAADRLVAESLAARNLSIAAERGLSICTLCSSCGGALTEVSHHLAEDQHEREEINRRLQRIGRHYDQPVSVKHFVRILLEDVGLEEIRAACTRSLEGLRLAAHYGCHYLKPSLVHGGIDSVEDPRTLDELLALTGASPMEYSRKKTCCGGSVLVADQGTALEMARDKLEELRTLGADALVVICPFCGVMYDSNQKVIEKDLEQRFNLPVLYLSQVLGLAMGMDENELGLKTHAVKTKDLMEKIRFVSAER